MRQINLNQQLQRTFEALQDSGVAAGQVGAMTGVSTPVAEQRLGCLAQLGFAYRGSDTKWRPLHVDGSAS